MVGGTLELAALLPVASACPVNWDWSPTPAALCTYLHFWDSPALQVSEKHIFQRGRSGYSSVLIIKEKGAPFRKNSSMQRRFESTVSSGSLELFSKLYLSPTSLHATLGKASTRRPGFVHWDPQADHQASEPIYSLKVGFTYSISNSRTVSPIEGRL